MVTGPDVEVSGAGSQLRCGSVASLTALTALAIAPRAAEERVLMQVMRNLAAKIRKWLGLGKRPAGMPFGTGAPFSREVRP